jgi:hypothetical protein
MKYRWLWFLVLVLILTLVSGLALAKTLYVQRNAVEIKKGQGAFHPTVYTAKKGEAFEVLGQEGQWFQVQTPSGPGWVFEKAVDEKKPGGSLASFLGTADSSDLDKTAGFKGFDAPTEGAYIKQKNLGPQLKMVDRIQQPAFSPNEMDGFLKQGRLGQYGGGQ